MAKKYFKIKEIRKANNYSSENKDYVYKVADIYHEEKEFEILIKCTHVENVFLGKRGAGRWEVGKYLELEYKEKWEREIFSSQIKIYWTGSSSYYHHLRENNSWVSPDLGMSEYNGDESIILSFINSPEKDDKEWRVLPAKYLAKKYRELWQKNTENQQKIARLETKLNLLEQTKTRLENELAQEKQVHQQTKTNFQSQLRDLATILFPSNSDINSINFSDLKEQAEKIIKENQDQTTQIQKLKITKSTIHQQTQTDFLIQRKRTQNEVKETATSHENNSIPLTEEEREWEATKIGIEKETDLTRLVNGDYWDIQIQTLQDSLLPANKQLIVLKNRRQQREQYLKNKFLSEQLETKIEIYEQ